MFIVMAVQRKATIDLHGEATSIDLKFASGMIGVLPVFMSRKAAERFAKKKFTIVEIGERDDAVQ
jgi:hypothetical protein